MKTWSATIYNDGRLVEYFDARGKERGMQLDANQIILEGFIIRIVTDT